jgi:hypothetical protein
MAHDVFSGEDTAKNFALSSSVGADEPLVWTPSAVKSELMRVLTIVDTVNLEMSQAVGEKRATDAEWKAWRQLYATAHKYLTGASRLWGSNVVVARIYEREANKWRTLLESRGTKPVGPADQGTARDPKPFFTPMNIALALGGTLAATMFIQAVKK